MLSDPNVVYLDVRSPEEFAQGHPAGAFNLPLAFLEPGRGPSRPNPEFLQIASRHFSPDTVVLVGCQSGGRSLRACDLLGQAGFTSLSNVQGGFGGGRDRSGGLVRGWRDCGLPTESGEPSGRSYTHLTKSSE
jgi:rhodanese-related sulfurtransferase